MGKDRSGKGAELLLLSLDTVLTQWLESNSKKG